MKTQPEDYAPAEATVSGPLFDTGPFDLSRSEPTEEERTVAELIWRHRGQESAVAIARIVEATKYSYRDIKSIVEILRKKHSCQIGARHEDPAGYFWIDNDEDRKAAVGPIRSQVEKMFETLVVLDTLERNRELLDELKTRL